MARSLNDDALQALALLRMHLDSGVGVETALFYLSRSEFGMPARRARSIIAKLQHGEELNIVLSKTLKKTEKKHRQEELLWSALIVDSGSGDKRLESASEEILQKAKIDSEQFAAGLSRVTQLVGVVMMLGILPAVFSFLGKLPEDSFIPAFKPNPMLVYGGLIIAAFLCLFLVRKPKE